MMTQAGLTNAVKLIAVPLFGLLWAFSVARGQAEDARWDKAKEDALRSLVAREDVALETYLSEGPLSLPRRRLYVPRSFVELYKSSPIDCLATLEDIVEHGNGHDALVAFHFGMAGDEPQTALPLFAYLSSREMDMLAEGATYRQRCLRMIQRETSDRRRNNP